MSYTPVDIPAFGGLDFSDEQDASGATDLLNCYVKQQGRLEVRPGYEVLGAATAGIGASGSLAFNAFTSFTNLVANPDFESGTGNWTGTSCTLTQSGSAGSRFLTITPSGPGKDVSALSDYISVSASTTYVAQASLLSATGSLYNLAITVKWYKSDNTYISQSTIISGSTPTTASVSVTSPPLTAKAKISIAYVRNALTDTVTCDSFLLTSGTYSGGFFTGTSNSASSNIILGYKGSTDTVRLIKGDGTSPYSAITGITATASTDKLNKTNHGLPDGTKVTLSSLTGGAGLSTSTTYYVVSSAANDFKLSTTQGGSAVNITTDYTDITLNPSELTYLTTGNAWSFASANGKAYGANGKVKLVEAGVDIIKQPTVSTKTSGATSFTSGRDAPKPLFVALQTPDNRLVAAGYTGTSDGPNQAATTPATVFFSQPDDPLKWDETDYVIVGDAQDPITGVANWGDIVVVFKANDWFLFYGNSIDADGGAVFNYRRIEPGCEMVSYAVGANGLYVSDTESNIHIFTGGVPQIVFRGSDRYQAQSGQGFNAHPLVGLPAIANGKTGYLIIDDRLKQTYFFSFDVGLTAGTNSGQHVFFPHTTGLAKFPSGTKDNGTTITASYTAPSTAFGQPGVEKTVRQTEIHGTGTVDLSWGVNNQSHGSATSVEMRNGRGLTRRSVRGETLSWKVQGSDWAIRRVIPYLRELRVPGVKT